MASPSWMPEGNTGKPNDTRLRTLQKILGSLNDGGGGGGGGSVSSSFASANYSGGQPTFTPPGTFGEAKDTVTGRIWVWDGTSWA